MTDGQGRAEALRFASLFGESRPIVLYVGPFGLPGTGAAAGHCFNTAVALDRAGYRVVMLPFSSDGRGEDTQSDGTFIYRGIPYIPAGDPSTGSSMIETAKVYTGHRSPVLDLLKRADLTGVGVMITAEGTAGYLLKLRSFCRRRGIALIAQEVEWHERSEPDNTRGVVAHLDSELRLRLVNPTFRHAIVVSTFLHDYYRRRGCRVLRLPPILDVHDQLWNPPAQRDQSEDGRLRLIFSGSPGRDRQDLILQAVCRARAKDCNVTIEYVGSSREKLRGVLGARSGILDKLGPAVVCHGWVTEERLTGLLASADFTVLLREDGRWSRACFPSKVPEFLALGVPIICNRTSDLGEYLRDGFEALLVPELSEASLAETLMRAAALNAVERAQMTACARRRAEDSFDVRRHAELLGKFVEVAASQAECRLLNSS